MGQVTESNKYFVTNHIESSMYTTDLRVAAKRLLDTTLPSTTEIAKQLLRVGGFEIFAKIQDTPAI